MTEYTKIPNVFVRETHGNNKLIMWEYTSPELEYLALTDWEWTEKIDGTNIRIVWDGYRVEFKGRTDKAQIPAHLLERLEALFGGKIKEELFEQMFFNKGVVLYGEGYGRKIQKHGELYGDVDFILFDVAVNGKWLDRAAVCGIAKSFGVKSVPVVGHGTLEQAVEYVKGHPESWLRDYEMEGIVARPKTELLDHNGGRIIVKIKCRDFELQREDEKVDK